MRVLLPAAWRGSPAAAAVQSLLTLGLALCVAATVGEGLKDKPETTYKNSGAVGKTARSYSRAKAEPPARPNSYWDDPNMQPVFDNTTNRNMTTQLGKTAYLQCRVKNLGDRTVAWIRERDLHILTVGRYTYTSDQRFQAIHLENSEDWTLQIKYPQKRDAGVYECQISTEPKISMFFTLNVVDEDYFEAVTKPPIRRTKSNKVATAVILGAPDLYIKSGSTISLTCIITQSPQPPVFVFWYHNDKVINYDSPRGGVSVETEKSETTTSKLLITNAKASDSGNYTCNPSNADAASIIVHVLNGEKPEAIQHGGQSACQPHFPLLFILVLLPVLLFSVIPVAR